MRIEKEFLGQIRLYKQHGDISKIAKSAKCAPSYVYKILQTGQGTHSSAVTAIVRFYAKEIPLRKKAENELLEMQKID